jgi:hypothetical protein
MGRKISALHVLYRLHRKLSSVQYMDVWKNTRHSLRFKGKKYKSEKLGVYGRIILKGIIKKWEEESWTGIDSG